MTKVILTAFITIGIMFSSFAQDAGKASKTTKHKKEMKGHQCSEECMKSGKCPHHAQSAEGKTCNHSSADAQAHKCSEACMKDGKCTHAQGAEGKACNHGSADAKSHQCTEACKTSGNCPHHKADEKKQ